MLDLDGQSETEELRRLSRAALLSHHPFVIRLVECCFTSTETVGLLGTGAQDVHFDFHTAPELSSFVSVEL